ncbi:biopolymer transporter ExbD [Polyangium sp. 6x1]|uniref:ExbD/TolR family protein n=1 Tax=Polyangium sp. 6x1 TaxID=3042689 RepID=UPI002482E258|nr:biopolymer transporter ExbD [Polyangium sp. 6x1]MDI1442848.1 biopolymer transporter ExbD [Polyangium sp. 6x1]
MLRLASASGFVSTILWVAACNKENPGVEADPSVFAAPGGTVIVVSGVGPMRCTPIGSATAMPSALPLDLPRASSADVQIVFSVELHANGETFVDQRKMQDDAALLAAAREARAKDDDVRAVIRADGDVPHRRVIRTLDLLKQAGLSKIAFGVTPTPVGGTP